MSTLSPVLDEFGSPIEKANGKPRPQLLEAWLSHRNGTAKLSYDAARDTTEYKAHWANADALDADSANSQAVRHKLRTRSRYEYGSNAYYSGIIGTHVNMLVGVGPTLRMLTGNEVFNQLVEREFWSWWEAVDMNRKLRCMAHAKTLDGEAFGVFITNPEVPHQVQLDIKLIEAEQVQSPFISPSERNYVDGIKFDDYGNILWYDVLPEHPGSANGNFTTFKPVRVSPANMLHWFTMLRPGQHRGVPPLVSSLNVGASFRRMREATLAAAETAADLNVMLTTQPTPDATIDPMAPFSAMQLQKRMMTAAPMGWEVHHFKSEHPNATYADFHRLQVAELGRPLHMPYNLAAGDSSTYSFASGKLDFLGEKFAIDVERLECDRQVLSRIFAAWFREWTILVDRRDIPPEHQWDWPQHPIIDVEAEARAADMQLKNGSLSLREYHSNAGRDYEDDLRIQAADAFGATDESAISVMRKINILRNTPAPAMPFVAQLLGVSAPPPTGSEVNP